MSATIDRTATLQRLEAFRDEIEAEAQRNHAAAMWRQITRMGIAELADIVAGCDTMAEFIYAINEL